MATLDELFNRNPLELTKDDITTIIQAQRKNRAQFNLGFKRPKAKSAAKPKMKLEEKLDLDGLFDDDLPAA